MAKENIIGLSMGLDTSSLKAGLQDAARRIKEVNATFYSETAGMENWQKDTAGLTAKLNQLTKTLDIQKKALDIMEKEYEDVYKGQNENSAAASKLRTQILKQKGEIAKTEKGLRQFKTALDQTEKEEKDLGKVTDKTTKELKEQDKQVDATGDGFTTFKGIVANVAATIITSLTSAFSNAISNAIELNRELGMLEATARSTGTSFEKAQENLNKVAAITNDTGAAVEGLNNLMTAGFDGTVLDDITDLLTSASIKWKDTLKFEGLADGLQETLATGSAIGPFAELLERSGIELESFNQGLANASTEAEKHNFVLQTLTDTGLLETLEAYKEVNGVLVDYNEASLENKQTMADLGEVLLPVKTFLLEIGTAFTEKLIPVIERAMPYIEAVGGMILDLFNGEIDTSKLGNIFNFVVDAAKNMFDNVIELIPQITSALVELLPQIASVVLEAYPDIFEKITSSIPTIVGFITDLIPVVIQYISDILLTVLPMMYQLFMDIIVAIAEQLPEIIDSLLETLPSIISAIISVVTTSIPLLLDAAIQLFNALIDAIPVIIESLIEHLPTIINSITDGLLEGLPVILDGAIQVLLAILDAIPVLIGALVPLIPQIILTIIGVLFDLRLDLYQAFWDVLLTLLAAIPKVAWELLSLTPELITAIIDGIASGWEDIKQTGYDLITGIWEGIKSAEEWLKGKISGFAEKVTGWFKGDFLVNSPSLLMKKEIGLNIGYGVGEGVIESLPVVKRDINKFNKQVIDGFNVDKPNLNTGGVGSNIATSNSTNFTQIINAPKQPPIDELYRRTGNLIDLSKVVTQ